MFKNYAFIVCNVLWSTSKVTQIVPSEFRKESDVLLSVTCQNRARVL